MKAIRIHDFGGSELIQLEEIPTPETRAGYALVRIRAAGVNPVDWMIREKIYNPEGMNQVPLTLGQDFAGVIEKMPPHDSETHLKVGDAVFGEAWGTFAEYALVPIKDLVPLPRGINFTLGASIPMPALTAWQMIHRTAHVRPGMKLLIHGASGGVGSFAVQFAKLKGAEVIATASRHSFEFLRSIGSDEIIDYEKEKFEDTCHSIDAVIDPKGGLLQARSWAILKKGGMLINLIGEIDQIAAKKHGVRGILFGMEYNVDDLREIAHLVEQGRVRPHISQVLTLADARKALDLNQKGESHGKIILKVA